MKLPMITDIARGTAQFVKYQEGNLWYMVRVPYGVELEFEKHFEFPIPIDDAGGGEFLVEDRALRFLRWIRKHHEFLTAAMGAQEP